MAANFIGALISLTSKSEMRFQGRLSALNSEEATITLENVRACGTEGRKAALGVPHEEMGPNPDVYEVIVFRAADVKDLRIDDPTPLPSAAAGANERVKEAAQTQASNGPSPAAAPARAAPVAQAAPAASAPPPRAAPAPAANNVPAKPAAAAAQAPASSQLPAVPHAATAAAGRPRPQQHQQQPQQQQQQQSAQRSVFDGPRGGAGAAPAAVPDDDFDFAAMNAKFEKGLGLNATSPAQNALDAIPSAPAEPKSFYDKSTSFFDSISSERQPLSGGGGGRGMARQNRTAEEHRNMSTFGEPGAPPPGRERGRGRGRGRGGRGRGRGRGDHQGGGGGGFQQNA